MPGVDREEALGAQTRYGVLTEEEKGAGALQSRRPGINSEPCENPIRRRRNGNRKHNYFINI
jgi:hypothetical protein